MVELRSQPALLIVDMQNGICELSGTFGKMGLPITNHLAIVPAIQRLRELAQIRNWPVIFTRICFNADYSDSGLIGETMPTIKELRGFSQSDVVIDKTRNTTFWRTGLEQALKERGIGQLIVAGVGTNVCVESSVRDAFTNGWPVVAVEDATATLSTEEHEASLKSMRWFGQTAMLADVEAALGQPKE